MASILPISIEGLLREQRVESERIEAKATWDEKTTGLQIIETICAFANDLYNVNGGYIVLGVAERDGVLEWPPAGIPPEDVDVAQRWIQGQCNRIDPVYQPRYSPEVVEGKHLLVVWAPASHTRPHTAPTARGGGERAYFVRQGAKTVKAKGPVLTDLMQLAAREPFDDRPCYDAALTDLREGMVREFLAETSSRLGAEPDAPTIYRQLDVSARINGHEVPRNVGLMMFSDRPEQWFRGARIEVAHLSLDPAAKALEEHRFSGPLSQQFRQVHSHLLGYSTRHLEKLTRRAEVKGWVSYPQAALDEALVNALVHRSYEASWPDPIKVHLYPDRMEIISYPGPVPGLTPEHFRPHAKIPPKPLRNRRIGEFFKELKLFEGRGTGVPQIHQAMARNGSPVPQFDFQEGESGYFRVTLPAHPEYVAISTLREVAHLRAIGHLRSATEILRSAFQARPSSALIAEALIEEALRGGDLVTSRATYDTFIEAAPPASLALGVWIRFLELLQQRGDPDADAVARTLLDHPPAKPDGGQAIGAAIQQRRMAAREVPGSPRWLKRMRKAHDWFLQAGTLVESDPQALQEFAQTKMDLAREAYRTWQGQRRRADRDANQRLLYDARQLLLRLTQMDAARVRLAWAWYHLSTVERWLQRSPSEWMAALDRAEALNDNDPQLADRIRRSREYR